VIIMKNKPARGLHGYVRVNAEEKSMCKDPEA
jgi:hypothetical protein